MALVTPSQSEGKHKAFLPLDADVASILVFVLEGNAWD